jgi:hypothetical protein
MICDKPPALIWLVSGVLRRSNPLVYVAFLSQGIAGDGSNSAEMLENEFGSLRQEKGRSKRPFSV